MAIIKKSRSNAARRDLEGALRILDRVIDKYKETLENLVVPSELDARAPSLTALGNESTPVYRKAEENLVELQTNLERLNSVKQRLEYLRRLYGVTPAAPTIRNLPSVVGGATGIVSALTYVSITNPEVMLNILTGSASTSSCIGVGIFTVLGAMVGTTAGGVVGSIYRRARGKLEIREILSPKFEVDAVAYADALIESLNVRVTDAQICVVDKLRADAALKAELPTLVPAAQTDRTV